MRAAAGGVTQTGRFQPEQVGHNLAANNSSVPMILVKASRHQSTMLMVIEDLTCADPASCSPTGSMPPCDHLPACRLSRSCLPPADRSRPPAPG